jgi:hypothetical protein
MSVSLADLYQRTGAKLGVVRSDESLSAEDKAVIEQSYAGLHEQLLSEALTTWAGTDALPDWAAPIMVDMTAALLVDDFGIEEPRRAALIVGGALGMNPISLAERKLRRQLALPYITAPQSVDYF